MHNILLATISECSCWNSQKNCKDLRAKYYFLSDVGSCHQGCDYGNISCHIFQRCGANNNSLIINRQDDILNRIYKHSHIEKEIHINHHNGHFYKLVVQLDDIPNYYNQHSFKLEGLHLINEIIITNTSKKLLLEDDLEKHL